MYSADIQWAFLCGPDKCGTPAGLTAHSTITAKTHHTQLKMTSSQNLSLFLILDLCGPELQLSLVAMVFAQQCWQANVERTENKIYHAESPPALWKWTIWQHSAQQNHCFIFHLLSYGRAGVCITQEDEYRSRKTPGFGGVDNMSISLVKAGLIAIRASNQHQETDRKRWFKTLLALMQIMTRLQTEVRRLHQMKKFMTSVRESDFWGWMNESKWLRNFQWKLCTSSNIRLDIITPLWWRGISLFLLSSSAVYSPRHLHGYKVQSLIVWYSRIPDLKPDTSPVPSSGHRCLYWSGVCWQLSNVH